MKRVERMIKAGVPFSFDGRRVFAVRRSAAALDGLDIEEHDGYEIDQRADEVLHDPKYADCSVWKIADRHHFGNYFLFFAHGVSVPSESDLFALFADNLLTDVSWNFAPGRCELIKLPN